MDVQPNQLAHQLFEMAISNRDALEIKLNSENGFRVLDLSLIHI